MFYLGNFFFTCVSFIKFKNIVINSERASYKSSAFAPKLERTRSVLIADLALKYLPENE